MKHRLFAALLVLSIPALRAPAQQPPDPKAGLHSVALTTLGATAKGGGAPWNKDWPPLGALQPGEGRGGTLFGAPMTGGRMDIRLVLPLDIKGIELFPLNYRGSRQIAEAEIYVDDVKVATLQLPHAPGKGHFLPLNARGQFVGVKVTGEHPPEDLGEGRKGATYGGWARIRVYSSTDVAAQMAAPGAYAVGVNPNFIAPTSGAIAAGRVEVRGEPRVAAEHPKTLWDAVDIAHYRKMIETSAELRKQYEGLKAAMDQRLTLPPGIPAPRQNDKGEWVHVSDRETGSAHTNLALDIANLGTVYALSGEEKYAEFAKRLLLAYADAYPKYGVGARPGFNHDPSRVFDQRLGDAIWLIQVARGYDLIHNAPMTDEERRRIEDDLIRAAAKFIAANSSHLRGATNWSAIGTCAILISGVATDDEDLVRLALFGLNHNRNPKNWWEGESNANPGGVELHFSAQAIRDDGLWTEGAMGYQFMALQALVADAEILWHRGIDLYRYRNAALKRLFDSPLEYSYPDLMTPAINDSGHGSIIGREAYLYEFAYERYRDPKYLLVLKQSGKHLGATYQQFPVSILYDTDLAAESRPVEWSSVNFFGVGYGILRNTTARGTVSLLMDYGKSGSHDHPDKLNIDLWAFGGRILPDPGSVWYEDPLYREWYSTTVAHNTLVVDELSQREGGDVDPDQLVYGPAESVGIQRARVGAAYSGVMMDRALFVTPEYTVDLFGAFGGLPRKMDLAWHPVGELESISVELQDFTFPAPVERGYVRLGETRAGRTADAYTAVVRGKAGPLRLVAAGGDDTQVVVGLGHLGTQRPPAILQRREAAQSVWANALDYSAAGVVRSVTKTGSLAAGYALAEVTRADGSDLCFAGYAPGAHRAGALETDALQAYVRRDGGRVTAAYLGGGTTLKTGGLDLRRSAPGLAYLERASTGAWLVGNPSPEAAVVTVAFDALATLDAHVLDRDGRRLAAAAVTRDGGAVTVSLEPAARVEFAPAGQAGIYEQQQEMLRKRMAEQEAELAARRNAIRERADRRAADAKNFPVPAGAVVIVQAEQFAGEGGGKVGLASNKRNAVGQAFSGWNGVGHWLEFAVEAPAAGYYHLGLVYCSEMDGAERSVQVNGETVDPDLSLVLPSTGGWANSSDDWRLIVFEDVEAGRPVLIKLNAGRNTIRLTNTNGRGANLDYLAVFGPDVTASRELLQRRMAP